VTSPHTRATQTALIAFRHLEGGVPVVCREEVREETGAHVCDRRRAVAELRGDFPRVDYGGVEEEDGLFGKERESKASLGKRIHSFLDWLGEREEEEVAVASHSGWLVTLFNGCVKTEEGSGLEEWFQTGEMRSVRLSWVKNE
jgi:broad specificity phosphatase PhoE